MKKRIWIQKTPMCLEFWGVERYRKDIESYDSSIIHLPRQYLSQHHGAICFPRHGKQAWSFWPIYNWFKSDKYGGVRQPPHRGTVRKLAQVGVPVLPHRASQLSRSDYDKFDYIIGMDTWNMKNINRILGGDPEGKVSKLLAWSGDGRDIATRGIPAILTRRMMMF